MIVAQDNIASCATERKLGFLLRVLWDGPSIRESVAVVAKRGDLLGGSTLGSVGMGWLILLCLISVVDRLGGSNLVAMRLGFTLGENTGRVVGRVAGACVGGRVLSSMWSFLLFLFGICCEEGWCVALARGLSVVERKDGEAAASEKISLRRVRSASGDCCKHAGILPFCTNATLPAAAITTSAGVTFGFEMYLCLWNTVSETLVAQVFNIQRVHTR